MLKRRYARLLIGLPGAALAAYLGIVVVLYAAQRHLIYAPDIAQPTLGALASIGVTEATIKTTDGLSLLAWYRPPTAGGPVIIYFHGKGGNLSSRVRRMRRFVEQGYGALLLEYRGYGGNAGTPSEIGLYADGIAAIEFIASQGIEADRMVIFGESLGTAVAVYVAAEKPLGALILESPFTSVAAIAQHRYPFVPAAALIHDRFDSLSRIGKVTAPVLVMSGGADRIVPPKFSQALFDAAPEPKERLFVAQGGHVNLDSFGGLDTVAAFINRHIR